ncbi:MAG: hypothetical protein P4L87_03000 [Formivibrio sp.]|nr:hypothetical protein [Formivibrio sp.]
MNTPFLNSSAMTFADVSSFTGIYNEASMNGRGAVVGKAARRVAAMARVVERSFSRMSEVVRPAAF